MSSKNTFASYLGAQRIIPILTLSTIEEGIAVTKALASGGVSVVEITFRTPNAAEILKAVRAELPNVFAGAGTILSGKDVEKALKAEAQFLITPGTPPNLCKELKNLSVPVLPGATTLTEMLHLAENGFTELKLFPAEPAGGVAYLKSIAGPCPHLTFCPTGGVTPNTAKDYLALPNVIAVGGSWLTPSRTLQEKNWPEICTLAQEARALTLS